MLCKLRRKETKPDYREKEARGVSQISLPDLENKNRRCPVKFELWVGNKYIFLLVLSIWGQFETYLYFKKYLLYIWNSNLTSALYYFLPRGGCLAETYFGRLEIFIRRLDLLRMKQRCFLTVHRNNPLDPVPPSLQQLLPLNRDLQVQTHQGSDPIPLY